MANVASIKGVRTRYRNTLEKELRHAEDIMRTDVSTLDISEVLNNIHQSKCLLKTYSEKLIVQMDKLADCLSRDDPDFVETVLDEDCQLNLSVDRCLIQLEKFCENVCSKGGKISDPSDTQTLVEMQEKMHKLMTSQMEQHSDLLAAISKKDKTEPSSVKLPKLELNMFSGNKLQWCEFWDVFQCTIHKNSKLSNIEKFTYLLSKLGGEAKLAVAGLARTNENYDVALKLLHERFGNKQEIVDLHYKELMKTQSPSNKVSCLRAFQDTTEKHLRSLEVLGEDVNQHVFISMIRTKLPEDVLRQLEFNKGSKTEWSLENLRQQLKDYIVACERAGKRSSEYIPPAKCSFSNISSSPRQHMSHQANSINRLQRPSSLYRPTSTAESLIATAKQKSKEGVTESKQRMCRYCEKNHWSDECTKYRTLDERKRNIKGCCFRCLKQGHMASECKSNKHCVYCGEYNRHHRSLCPRKFKANQKVETTSVSLSEEGACKDISPMSEENAMVSVGEFVFMQTATTEVKHPRSSDFVTTRILLDCGSQRTYITQSLATRLGLKSERTEELKVVTFGSSQSTTVKTSLTTIWLKLKNGDYMEIKANIVPVISGNIHRKILDISSMNELDYLMKTIELADSLPTNQEMTTVDLLLGNDYYLDIVLTQKMEVLPGLYLLSSKLGWILAGRAMSEDSEINVPNMLILTCGTNTSKTNVFQGVECVGKTQVDLQNFWNMDSIGIKDTGVKSDDEAVMETFKENIIFEDGRYYVTWPWKQKDPELPRNRELAYGRLKSCIKKLQRKPELLKEYNAVIQDQLEKGVIERVSNKLQDRLEHYIPHHAVVNMQKANTKVRVVYDASAKLSKDHRSLNECLYRGPVLLHDMCGLLMRFRLHKIGLVSDIEKAFLQVGLQPSERDVTRFLWIKDITNPKTTPDNIEVLRFCRVPFGIISSPFLLTATVENHLDSYNTDIAKKLKSDIYVDNIITGAKTVQEGIEMYQTAKNIFKDASMNIREWLSNSAKVNEFIPIADRAEPKDMHVLGHIWDYKSDTLALKQQKDTDTENLLTKRSILRKLASVFDPMGLFSPVVITGKTLLQDLWVRNVDWDETIEDQTIRQVWNDIQMELCDISKYKVQRYIGTGEEEGTVYNIVCFCDASKKAYAAVVYLHQEWDSGSSANLVFSKTRLAPVKEITIPRLELMAILIGVRCIQFVKEQLQLVISNTYLWSDSQVAIAWIKSDKSLPTFVKNRVTEIKGHSDIVIRYVNTKENPADIATKGATSKALYNESMWWYGPDWLNKPSIKWITDLSYQANIIDVTDKDIGDGTPVATATEKSTSGENHINDMPLGIDLERFSSITSLLRVTALTLKFVRKLRRKKVNLDITSEDMKEAEILWIKYIQKKVYVKELSDLEHGKRSNLQNQLGLYVDSEGIIRCKGRLENSFLEEGARRPILLPKGEQFTCLVIEKIHRENLHSGVSQTLAGVRSKYWIPHGRAFVKTVLQKCQVCRRAEGGPYRMPVMAPLPASRVREAHPFSKTGVDYFGPLLVRSATEHKKVWICLLSCMVTRAVHLEVIQDMTTEEFLLALKRFIAQRGTPDEVISDNAAYFKLASKTLDVMWKNVIKSDEVQSYASSFGINWHFIVELAPWMGGFYERLVGIVKRSLRKTIGRKLLTLIQLQTLIKEVEAVVNSRPLVYVGDDINSTITLTPSHFLTLNPKTGIPETENDSSDVEYTPTDSSRDRLVRIWQKGQKLLNEFWKIWRDQYLTSLRERTQTSLKAGRVLSPAVPKCGDIVLIKDNVPRGSWKTGKVIELNESRDKFIRSARVQLPSKKVLNRPLTLLYPLECSSEDCNILNENLQSPIQSGANRPHRHTREVAKQRIKEIFQHKTSNI